MDRCIVLNAMDVNEWPSHRFNAEALVIPAGKLSTVLQPDRATAEAEAERLALKTGEPFAVFQAVALCKTQAMPAHRTVRGEEIPASKVPTWVDVRSEL